MGAAFVATASGFARQPASPPLLPGKQVFDRWCAACHADSLRAPGTTALATKYGAALPAPLEQRKDLTPEMVALFVRSGISIMPSFRKTEISDAELAQLGSYLAHSKQPKSK